MRDIRVNISVMPIQEIMDSGIFQDTYFDDPDVRVRFQAWLNERWQAKDNLLEELNATQKPL